MRSNGSEVPEEDVPRWLFAYGTLGPASNEEVRRDGWLPDAVRGELYDLGPYPALVHLNASTAGWVSGYVRPVSLTELEQDLDPYEGTSEGLFGRSAARTRSGRWVWVYTYLRPLPPFARGPIQFWDGPRRRLPRGASTPLPERWPG